MTTEVKTIKLLKWMINDYPFKIEDNKLFKTVAYMLKQELQEDATQEQLEEYAKLIYKKYLDIKYIDI